jgi:serine/threonine protein phosphatase PrpC
MGCTRTGAAHQRGGLPCQDAHALWSGSAAGQPYLAVAIADGHGDARHDQSHCGAALAVRTAVHEMSAFHLHFGIHGSPAALKTSFKADFPRRVNRQWRAAVLEDARTRLNLVSENPEEEQRIYSRYGTTLLTALITADLVLLGQIGDGDFLFIRDDGIVDCPLPPDESLIGQQTASLSSARAPHLWQTTVLDRATGGVLLLATDGLANAFVDSPQFHTFARSLTERMREFGVSAVAESLPAWLDHYSAQGSGDDITLVLLTIPPCSANSLVA